MKDEGALNSYLGKEFSRLRPDVFHIKTSDRFQAGVSDFLLFKDGLAAALEVKFVKELPPTDSSKILKHSFTGAQRTFFLNMQGARCITYGLIGVNETRVFYLLPLRYIKSGNVTVQELMYDWALREDIGVFNFNQVMFLVDFIFGGDYDD